MKGAFVRETVDSTNECLKRMVARNEGEDCVVISRTQFLGKGRHGRPFFSPLGGFYASYFYRIPYEEIFEVTPTAAVAVYFAVRNLFGKNLRIKWLNDLFYSDKKVGGILAEGVCDEKKAGVVLGIGLNIFRPEGGYGYLEETARAIYNRLEYVDVFPLPNEINNGRVPLIKSGNFNNLLIRFAMEIHKNFVAAEGNFDQTLGIYRQRFAFNRRYVEYREGGKTYFGKILGVDDQVRLVLDTDEGKLHMRDGEIVRQIK